MVGWNSVNENMSGNYLLILRLRHCQDLTCASRYSIFMNTMVEGLPDGIHEPLVVFVVRPPCSSDLHRLRPDCNRRSDPHRPRPTARRHGGGLQGDNGLHRPCAADDVASGRRGSRRGSEPPGLHRRGLQPLLPLDVASHTEQYTEGVLHTDGVAGREHGFPEQTSPLGISRIRPASPDLQPLEIAELPLQL